MSEEGRPTEQWCGPCSICGAVGWGKWPHPEGEPCPQKVFIDEAYVAMLDAQRAYYERAAFSSVDFGELLRQASEHLKDA